MEIQKNKVILIDSSMIFVPTVKVVQRLRQQKALSKSDNFIMPPRAMYFNSLLSCLKKIGADKDDIIIMADEGHSFRKDIYAPYKAHREGLRKKDSFIDWGYEFKQLNKLHSELNESTNWHFIRVADGLEADDVIAISARYFKDKEVIIVTGDKNIYMLAHYPNVKIFSTTQKCKGSKGSYVKVDNPLSILSSKATNGDVADNILTSPYDTDQDYELRLTLVNLLDLPKYIEEKGINAIKDALSVKKELNLDKLPNFKDAKEKFLKIYKKDKIITPEYCYALLEKREAKKKKLLKEKRDAKRLSDAKEKFKNRMFESLTKREFNKLVKDEFLEIIYPEEAKIYYDKQLEKEI